MPSEAYVIEIRGLTRYYGARCIVNELSLQIPRGCVFGFLGRNGAGKSTTIRMLMGLVQPTRGTATLLGQDCAHLTPEIRARVGYLAEGHYVPGWMTVADAERFQSACDHCGADSLAPEPDGREIFEPPAPGNWRPLVEADAEATAALAS